MASKGLTQKGVTITGAKGTSTVTLAAGVDCVSLQSSGLPAATITTKYTATGGTAAATKFKPGSITVNTTATPLTAVLGGTGTTTMGSFKNGTAGSAASTATLVFNDTDVAAARGLSGDGWPDVHQVHRDGRDVDVHVRLIGTRHQQAQDARF